jgi:hypothetical protein
MTLPIVSSVCSRTIGSVTFGAVDPQVCGQRTRNFSLLLSVPRGVRTST